MKIPPENTQLLLGFHSVTAAVERSPGNVRGLVIASEGKNARLREVAQKARALKIAVTEQPRSELDRLSRGERHQDIVAHFRPDNIHTEKSLEALLEQAGANPLILVLDGVQDPHNLGACLRTADAAGVNFVILPKDRSAPLSSAARRAASGAAEALPILLASNLARVLRQLKSAGVWLAGTSNDASETIYDAALGGPLALVMGSEGEGMRRLTGELCDYLVRIPMRGTVGSLNVSVATAVCLFEIVRQGQVQEAG